jgi:hypothetical protein
VLLKTIKPPVFDGSRIIDWIFKIQQYMDTVDANATEPEKLRFASNLLSGRALTWWRHRQQNSATITTFMALKEQLLAEFVDIDHINKKRDELDNLV